MKSPPQWTKNINHNGQELTVTFQWIDNGIGSYEYWGARGNHVNYCAEMMSIADSNKQPIEVDDETVTKWEDEATEDYLSRLYPSDKERE